MTRSARPWILDRAPEASDEPDFRRGRTRHASRTMDKSRHAGGFRPVLSGALVRIHQLLGRQPHSPAEASARPGRADGYPAFGRIYRRPAGDADRSDRRLCDFDVAWTAGRLRGVLVAGAGQGLRAAD